MRLNDAQHLYSSHVHTVAPCDLCCFVSCVVFSVSKWQFMSTCRRSCLWSSWDPSSVFCDERPRALGGSLSVARLSCSHVETTAVCPSCASTMCWMMMIPTSLLWVLVLVLPCRLLLRTQDSLRCCLNGCEDKEIEKS